MTPEYIENRLEQYAIRLRSEGILFDKRRKLIAEYKDVYFSNENIEACKRILSVDTSGYDYRFELLKSREPNILDRKLNIDRSSKKK